jgi:diguanylate cyclase (GGDEF)-like protein
MQVHHEVKQQRQFETIDARQLESLRVFHEVARALTSNLELDAVLGTIVSKMVEFFGPEHWSLLLLDEETGELYSALSAGGPGDPMAGMRIPAGTGIVGRVASSGQPLVIDDMAADPVWSRYAAEHPEMNLHSMAYVPIRRGEKTLGVLQIQNSKLNLLPDASLAFLRVLCDYAAIALQNAGQVRLIHELSITDDCTGLFNARFLYASLEEEIATMAHTRVRPIHPYFSLLFLDLDHFKSVNDAHGHLVGTRLLAEVGSLLKRLLGPHHVGFRYGGDEFVALLRGLDRGAALEFAQRMREELDTAEFLTGEKMALKITASFGLATFPRDGDDLHSIIRAADAMMYCSKAEGRDRISVADGRAAMPVSPKTSRHS